MKPEVSVPRARGLFKNLFSELNANFYTDKIFFMVSYIMGGTQAKGI